MNPTTKTDQNHQTVGCLDRFLDYAETPKLDATQPSKSKGLGKSAPEANVDSRLPLEVHMTTSLPHYGEFRVESEATDTSKRKEPSLSSRCDEIDVKSTGNQASSLLSVISQTEQKNLDKLLSKLTSLRDLVVTGSTAVRLLTGATDFMNNDVDFLAPSSRQPNLDEQFRKSALLFDLDYNDRKFYSRGRPVVDITYLKVMPRDPVTVGGILVQNPQQLLEQYKNYKRPEDEAKIVLLQQLVAEQSHTKSRFAPKPHLSGHVCKKLRF